MMNNPDDQLHADALAYHRLPFPGKMETRITTSAETARDLSLAYSPGVGEPVRVIADANRCLLAQTEPCEHFQNCHRANTPMLRRL